MRAGSSFLALFAGFAPQRAALDFFLGMCTYSLFSVFGGYWGMCGWVPAVSVGAWLWSCQSGCLPHHSTHGWDCKQKLGVILMFC